MKQLLLLVAFTFCINFLMVPTVSQAQEGMAAGLVACTGAKDCNFCTLVTTANNVINLLFTLLVIAAVIMMVIAGLKLVTSGGNVSAMESAKSMVTNVLIGFVIVLSAWLIVDTIMKMLVKDGEFGMWNRFDNCGGIKSIQAISTTDDVLSLK